MSKYVGIVGHEAKKFTADTKEIAVALIRTLLSEGDILVSGGCHLGGIDIWAEEVADEMGIEKLIFYPQKQQWEGGYKQRNLLIAGRSDIVHCIVVKEYPPFYVGRVFDYCYHCDTSDHIKSGGCWTAKRAREAQWHVI
jgi:hypothetical protein